MGVEGLGWFDTGIKSSKIIGRIVFCEGFTLEMYFILKAPNKIKEKCMDA